MLHRMPDGCLAQIVRYSIGGGEYEVVAHNVRVLLHVPAFRRCEAAVRLLFVLLRNARWRFCRDATYRPAAALAATATTAQLARVAFRLAVTWHLTDQAIKYFVLERCATYLLAQCETDERGRLRREYGGPRLRALSEAVRCAAARAARHCLRETTFDSPWLSIRMKRWTGQQYSGGISWAAIDGWCERVLARCGTAACGSRTDYATMVNEMIPDTQVGTRILCAPGLDAKGALMLTYLLRDSEPARFRKLCPPSVKCIRDDIARWLLLEAGLS